MSRARAWVLDGGFGLEHLRLEERSWDPPGEGEVGVRIHAASLNYRDLLMVQGKYNRKQPLPMVPLSDGAGVVEALGPRCERFQVGDRVATVFAPRWIDGSPSQEALRFTLGGPMAGVLSEYVVLPEAALLPFPAHLSEVEASTLPCAALTAWNALVTQGRTTAGESVLIMGTGGVATFALQFSRMLGARVILLSSHPQKAETLSKVASFDLVDYRRDPQWPETVRRLTGYRGVDHVVELGGAGTLGHSLKALRPGGTLSLIGVLAGGAGSVDLTPILMRHVRVQGIFVGSLRSYEAMNRAIGQHRLRPVIDRSFSMDEAPQAFRYLESAGHVGKVCIRVSAD